MDTFGIPLAFLIVTALVLWAVIGGRGWWWLKALMVVGTFLFSISLWHSLESLEGWPTDESMPDKFEIKWIVVEEPNIRTGDKGEILVWSKNMTKEYKSKSSIPLLHNKEKSDDPRLHRLPYSREMHKQAQDIQKKIAAGGKYYGEMKDGKMEGKGEGKGKGSGQGKGGDGKGEGKGKSGQKGDGGSLSQEQDPIFHELPPPYFIPKDQ